VLFPSLKCSLSLKDTVGVAVFIECWIWSQSICYMKFPLAFDYLFIELEGMFLKPLVAYIYIYIFGTGIGRLYSFVIRL
jgi:hypothetical protein